MRQSKDDSEGSSSERSGNHVKSWIVGNWRSLTVLSAIVLIAFMLRVLFAYGTSAGSGFALSGGSDAAYHLHVIERILTTGGHVITDPALNYPFGGLNYNPPLFDWSVAILAFPLKLLGFSATEAASAALVFSTAIVGALTCIPVYLLAKEMFSRKIGIVAAAFFAISSVAIVKTVFSNGTESAYFVFFFVLTSLFMLRALKAFKQTDDKERSVKGHLFAPFNDKKVFRNMLFASLSLTALIYSWIGFLFVIMVFSAMMLVQVILDRLRGKNAMSYISIYGSVMLFSLLLGFLYYGLVMGMYTLIGGPLLLALLISVISFVIAHFRVWVITIPVCIIAAVAVLAAIAFTAPSLYAAMTSGFQPYADGKFGQLINAYSSVTLSTQAIYAGIVTMWFSFIVAAWRVFNVPKNVDSKPYMFITMWFIAMILMSWKNIDLAYLAAPMYAIGTGVVIMWVLRRVHIKDYVESFKGCTIRTVWRKILKPVPFVAVLATVLMLLMPNMLYAVDASIPSNNKSDYNADMHLGNPDTGSINYLGATNYYIKDSDWNMSKAWDRYIDESKSGALVTWLDYGAEAAGKGNFQVVADHFGNGSAAASNILLGSPQDALAAMTVRLLQTGDGATIDTVIASSGIPSGIADGLKRIIHDGKVPVSIAADASNRDYVAMNSGIFGPTDANITDENAMYLVAAYYLKQNLTDGEISDVYNAVIDETGYEIGYIGVSGSMLPLYYGDNSLFSTMAYLNDYYLDRNAAPTKYYSAGIPYYGYYYTYTSAMYETMIWKALVGMSLEDYRAQHNDPSLSFNTLIRGLMLSDGTYKAYPGYGLSNFGLDAWWVLYNPQADAGGEWVLMDGWDAQALQASNGGVINYLGGMAFLKYDEDCTLYSGTVETPSGDGVKGMTVAFYDAADPNDLKLIGVTKTGADGRYGIMVPDDINIGDVAVNVYSGPVNSMEVETNAVSVSDGMIIEITEAELKGTIGDLAGAPIDDIMITMTGSRSGMEYSFVPTPASPDPEFTQFVVPDTYSVKITMNNLDLYSGTFTLYSGEMDVGMISAKSVAVTVTVNDKYGNKVPGALLNIYSGAGDLVESGVETDSSGVARTKIAPGSYTVQLKDNEYDSTPGWILVSNSSTSTTTAFTAKLGSSSTFTVVMVEASKVSIDDVATGDIITFTNGAYSWRGAYTATAVVGTLPAEIWLPTGDYGDASAYSAAKKEAGTGDMSYAKVAFDGTNNTVGTVSGPDEWILGDCDVEITMTYGDDNEDTAGIVAFIDGNGMIITVPVGIPGTDPVPPVKIPTGDYTIYAYATNLEKKAYLGSVESADMLSGTLACNIKLEEARIVSGTVNYAAQTTSSTSTKVVFVPVVVTVRDKAYTFEASTDALGSYYIMVPKSETYYTNTETFFGKMIAGHHMFMRALNNVSTTTTNTDTGRNILVIANYAQTDDVIDLDVFTPSLPIGSSGLEVTVTGSGTDPRTIVFKNTTDSVIYVYLSSDEDLTYSSTPNKEWAFSLSPSGTRTMSAVYTALGVDISVVSNVRAVEITKDVPADLNDSVIEVKQSGSVMNPDLVADPTGRTYNLTSGYYELTIKPDTALTAGDDSGYYYSGPMRVFADVISFDVTDLVTGMTVVEFDAGKDDKVSLSGTGWVESSASDPTPAPADPAHKIFFVPTDRLEEFTITVSNSSQIGYADLSVSLVSSSFDMRHYMGEKITVSGYVGRTVDGTMEITMTSVTTPANTGTVIVSIKKGEYTATLPKTMNDPAEDIEYVFFASVNDSAKGTFTAEPRVMTPGTPTELQVSADNEAKVNMEVELPSWTTSSDYMQGDVTDAYGDPLAGVAVKYEVTYGSDVKTGTVNTNAGGHYLIAVLPGYTSVEIIEVTKTNYTLMYTLPMALSAPPASNDFSMSLDVYIDVTSIVLAADGDLIKATITMNVTNGHNSTVLLFPNKAWITPTFKVDGVGSANYAVIPNDTSLHTVELVAYYDPAKIGAGSNDLSITVRDLLGSTLQTKVFKTNTDPLVEGHSADLDVTSEGNRVSKDEYGYAAAFKNTTGNWVEVTLSIGGTVPAGWFASIVDSDNVILENLTVLIPGNSVKTYYVRLISEGEVPSAVPTGFWLEYDDGTTGVQVATLSMDPTSLTVNGQKVTGDNIFDRMNGMPDIVWALIALILLTALLIVWLGMRRGVFTRKR